jgi:hypothetical protein
MQCVITGCLRIRFFNVFAQFHILHSKNQVHCPYVMDFWMLDVEQIPRWYGVLWKLIIVVALFLCSTVVMGE